jgi:hypothetical protein
VLVPKDLTQAKQRLGVAKRALGDAIDVFAVYDDDVDYETWSTAVQVLQSHVKFYEDEVKRLDRAVVIYGARAR